MRLQLKKIESKLNKEKQKVNRNVMDIKRRRKIQIILISPK